MQLTKQTNYALRALIYCAANAPRQSRVAEIAAAYGISELSLFKFIKPLVDNGLLRSVRGRNGGISLGRAADEITMREVVVLVEEHFALAECFELDAECPLIGNCEVNSALRAALTAFLDVLEDYTIADLAKRQTLMRGLLGIEQDAEIASAV